MMQEILKKAAQDPKKLFLFDSIGALISAIFLGLVLTKFESIFGMPIKSLHYLSFMALGYMVYSFLCYALPLKKWQPFLLLIAILNLMHCIVTIVLMFIYSDKLQILGWVYFIGEIIIVVFIAYIEAKTARIEIK